jgi:hypothetical protein
MRIPETYLTVSITLSGCAILHLPLHSVVCTDLEDDLVEQPVLLAVDEVFGVPWFYYLDQGEWYEIKGERA